MVGSKTCLNNPKVIKIYKFFSRLFYFLFVVNLGPYVILDSPLGHTEWTYSDDHRIILTTFLQTFVSIAFQFRCHIFQRNAHTYKLVLPNHFYILYIHSRCSRNFRNANSQILENSSSFQDGDLDQFLENSSKFIQNAGLSVMTRLLENVSIFCNSLG